MRTRRTLLALAFAIAVLVPVQAFASSWVVLGTRTVNLLYGHDTIWVGAGKGLYTNIRLVVAGNTLFMRDLNVTFANGTSYDVPIRFMFLPGTASRVIALPGVARFIRRIDISYDKLPAGGSAAVTLQGLKL